MAAARPVLAAERGSGSSAYVIGGIAVDTAGKTTYEARMAAYRVARGKAWPKLWAQLSGLGEASAPRLGDGAIDAMVSAIEIEGEQFSTTRYIATLGVVFDRARASRALAGTSGALHSGPMLLLPVFTDGGVSTLYHTKTPWLAAFQRFSDSLSPIDYVVAGGSAGDNLVLTSYQVQRADRSLWRNILNRFGTIDVLIAEVRLTRDWPGGPIAAEFIARHGPDAVELGRFTLAAPEADLDTLLDAGVQRIDAIYTSALRDGRLRSDPSLAVEMAPLIAATPQFGIGGGQALRAPGIDAEVVTPDAAAWSEMERQLRATPTITGVELSSLSLGGTSRIVIRYTDTAEMLLYQLDQRGLRLADGPSGKLLRRREPGDPPVPMPAVAAPPIVPPQSGATAPSGAAAPPPGRNAPSTGTPLPASPPPGPRDAPPALTPREPRPGPAPIDLLPAAPPPRGGT